MKRTFIAIDIPASPKLIHCISDIRLELHQESIRWVPREQFHITLKFLGDTENYFIEGINLKLKEIADNAHKFSMSMNKIGVFKNIISPRVLWAGIKADEELNRIISIIEDSMVEFGFEKTNRKFTPHLTIGRIKYINNRTILSEIIDNYKETGFGTITIHEIVFYESILKKTGPEYVVLGKHQLRER
ncbi:MAG: RNA 2',3'-cyclic phosphodiesterase [Bacteroidales bacterium]|nr:RNA 2',3'-cyclic phosphodiesterase [Bacteroidales bacterium]